MERPRVLVSLAPYKSIIEGIAGELVDVDVVVPPGTDIHSWEPTPRQVARHKGAVLWFQVGEAFEPKMSRSLTEQSPQLKLIDLRVGLPLLDATEGCCCGHLHGKDPHIWLSARLMKKQAERITSYLNRLLPEHTARFSAALQRLLQKLTLLDKEVESILAPMNPRVVLVAHPAYSYFCHDYNIRQLSLEREGREPSPRQLIAIIDETRALGVPQVIALKQFGMRSANSVSKRLSLPIAVLDPYKEDFFALMRETAQVFSGEQIPQ